MLFLKLWFGNLKNRNVIVPVKEGENIERAFRSSKPKFERTGAVKQLRARPGSLIKPSVFKEKQLKKATQRKTTRRS